MRKSVVLTAILAGGCASPQLSQDDRTAGHDPASPPAARQMAAREAGSSPDQTTAIAPFAPVSYDDGMLTAFPVQLPRAEDTPLEPAPNETLDQLHTEAVIGTLAGNPQPVDHFVALALERHPSIQAARQRVAAANSRIPQARALPDPMFTNTFWPIHDQSLQTAAGRVGNQMSLSQTIPWPKKLAAKASVAHREAQMARAEANRIEREIVEAVRLAYCELWFATRAMAIIEEMKDLVDDWNRVAEARYRSGGTQQDVLRARLESDRLQEKLINLSRQRKVAQADLAALVQQPVDLVPEADDLGLTEAPQRLAALIAAAERCNPELVGLDWELKRDRQRQQLACLQSYPDLQVGLQWGSVSDNRQVLSPVANGHDTISFQVGTTIPLWRGKIDAGIREATHHASSTTRRLDAERSALFGKLRRLLAQADALVDQREIYQQRIIPRSEHTLRLTIADWRGDRADFFSLIETYRELLALETQLARINASLAGTLAQIERAVGCPQ